MSGWRAIVFDLDDTLYPEQAYVFSGFRAVAAWAEAHLDIPAGQGFAELKHLFEQGRRGDTFNLWLAAHEVAPGGLVSHLVQVYREHQPALVPFPEVPDMLASLQRRYRLGLVSDGYLRVQQRKLAALGLVHYFDAVVFSDAWGRAAWKPSTKPFEIALERLACEAARSMYVADNPLKDFLGARQLGMVTVRVCRPAGEYGQLSPPTPQYAPDLTIRSVTELGQVLAK